MPPVTSCAHLCLNATWLTVVVCAPAFAELRAGWQALSDIAPTLYPLLLSGERLSRAPVLTNCRAAGQEA